MSIHDKMAYQAFIDGRRAEDFHRAAQQHANATWISLCIAALVWLFTSWVWALIPLVVGLFTTIQSISSTMIETRLEKIEYYSTEKKDRQ